MAPAQTGAKPAPKKTKKKTQNTATTTKKPRKQKMQTQPGGLKKEVKKVERKIQRLEKKTDGPKANDSMTTTVTLGVISGQEQTGLNRQLRVSFNPLLMKASEGANTTPLSIRGSMYELWKIAHAELRATPLSGFSNVVGSVGFMALTLNGLEAGADSIDTVKARKHVQMALGRPAKLRLTARDLAGPREGWWLVDTSEDPAEAYGPAVDLFLAYKTNNLMTTNSTPTSYLGSLWQIELKVTYMFSTYHPKPGLQNLVCETLSDPANVTIKTTTDGSLVMSTTNTRLLRLLEPRVGGQTSGKSQTVWAVAGAAVEAAAGVLGPWGWLLKGGFWLVRKIFGAAGRNAGETLYQVYPSITAAQQDQPIYGGTGSSSVSIPVVHVSEVINPNPETNPAASGMQATAAPAPERDDLTPYRPSSQPSPLYGYTDSQEVASKPGSTFIFGNFRWRTTAGANTRIGYAGDSITVYTVAVALLDEKQGVFGQCWPAAGPNGVLGTGETWTKALKSKGLTWYPTTHYQLPDLASLYLPVELKNRYELTSPIVIVPSRVLSAVGSGQSKANDKCYLLITSGDSLVIVGNASATAGPGSNEWIEQPLVVAAGGYSGSTRNISIRDTSRDEQLDSDDDDDISLAESFLGCGDPLEDEREALLRRLRELDSSRLTAG
nr:MAG: capsid protein precursor [Astroviridae sp.]